MAFSVSQRTLEQLDWPGVLARLAERARTPRGRRRLLPTAEDVEGSEAGEPPPALFEATESGMRERLAETSEARAVLASGDRPPLEGVRAVEAALGRAARGGVLSARELRDLGSSLAALRGTARFLRLRHPVAPRLAGYAERIADLGPLERALERALDPSGEVADAASPALAAARAESRRLAAQIQARSERIARDPDIAPWLSDSYITVRNDRYVLPVRADARGHVRGIVHDASNSGTTLFVEPEALVELNNRLKQAELEVERETLRVLRDLSARAAAVEPEVRAGLEALEAVDLAFARADLADALRATAPEVGDAGVLRLPGLRHPGLPADAVVPNDLCLGEGPVVLVVSGPNAGGKTVAMKAAALAVLFARAGLHVPAGEGARVDLFDAVLSDIGDEQDIRASLSTFSAHMANLARILAEATRHSLVVLDEVGAGTDPGEGAALAQAVLECFAERGARTIATTHLGLLKEMAEVDDRFVNASVEFDPETLAPTYRLRTGIAGASAARSVAARMGLPSPVLERAGELLDRDDRQLDHLLSELATSRAALEREQREVAGIRAEAEAARADSEALRAAHREKLEKLLARRDALYRSMRADLERAFRDAHERVAAVIRELQQGGPSARDAAAARERLLALESEERTEEEAGAAPGDAATAGLAPLDWRTAQPGDAVRVAGGGRGVLLALPDRRGRVAVRLGGARVVLPREQVGAAEPAASGPGGPRAPGAGEATGAPAPARVSFVSAPAPTEGDAWQASARCDLRGLRVDEALDRLVYALDRAAGAGRASLTIVHGLGTGALRDAVRRHLRESPYVAAFAPGAPEEGGEGTTRADLR